MDITDILVFDERYIDPTLPTGLWFCENVFEANYAGYNAVSLGIGNEWDGIEQFESWFLKFSYVFVAIADRTKRQEVARELRNRLPNIQLMTASDAAFKGYKSIGDMYKAVGAGNLAQLLCGGVEIPPLGLIDIAEVKTIDMTRVPRSMSGIPTLDQATGGFLFGDVTIWTGKRGQGKSTATGQVLLKAVDDGHVSCLYSGELRSDRIKNWLYLQAAGPSNVAEQKDSTGRLWYITPKNVTQDIDDWISKRLFLYDTTIAAAHDEDRIMSLFEFAVKRYGCKVFVIDNLMTTNLKRMKDADFYRAQSNFVGRCKAFAEASNVHVHIVAHPRKTSNVSDGDDISGSGDIANRADNVISVERFKESDPRGDTGLSLLKARWTGENVNVGLKFEPKSRRMYTTNGGNPNWRYGWELSKQVEIKELPNE